MKVKVVLLFSVCLNLALMAGWWLGQPSTPMTVHETATNQISTPLTKLFKTPPHTLTLTNDKQLNWSTVESEDYRQYIANLRAIGCPEETIRDIIVADVNKLYAGKIAALYPTAKEMKFWRVYDRTAHNEDKERDKKRHELEQEKSDLIKELLGDDSEYARGSGRPTDDDFRYGFLSAEKQEQAKALHDKYHQLEKAIFKDSAGWTAENRAKFAAVRAEHEAELAKLLGAADFEEYQLRNSWTARSMRDTLSAFQPNEDEFRKIYQVRKSFDDQYAYARDGGDDSLREQRKAAEQNLADQLKAALGEDRFREYQLSQDERFRDTYDFAQKYDLPRQTAETVYQVRSAAEQEKQRIQSDPSLPGDARVAALQGLAVDTGTALAKMLGEQNWNNYENSHSSRWIAKLGQPGDSSSGSHNHNKSSRH